MRKSRRLALHLPIVVSIAALGVVHAGCRFDLPPASTGDDGEGRLINAKWSFHNVSPDGRSLSPNNGCPVGYIDVALHTQQVDPVTGRDIGPEVVDVFDCAPGSSFSDPLEPGVYDAFIVVTADGGAPVYATSFSDIIDVTLSDQTFKTEIIDNGGYFKLGWDLRDQAQPTVPITCNQLIAGEDRVGLTATLVSNTSIIVHDTFGCELGDIFSTVTSPIPVGTYDIAIEPVNTNGQALPGSQSVVLQDKVMGDRNAIVDLGVITVAFP